MKPKTEFLEEAHLCLDTAKATFFDLSVEMNANRLWSDYSSHSARELAVTADRFVAALKSYISLRDDRIVSESSKADDPTPSPSELTSGSSRDPIWESLNKSE